MGLITDIVGKWNFVSSENFDEYLKEVGVGFMTRKIASNLKPTLEFSIDGDEWSMVSNSTFKNYVTKFKLGLPYDHETADGRDVTSVFTLENDKLIQNEKSRSGGKDSVIERYIENGQLVIKCTSGNVTSIRTYAK